MLSGVADKLVSGWAVNRITTFQDGFPMGLNENNPNALTQCFGGGKLRPNYTPGCKKTLTGSALSKFKSGQWFNAACFTDSSDFEFGNEVRVDGALTSQRRQLRFRGSEINQDRRGPICVPCRVLQALQPRQFNPPGVTVGGSFYNEVASQDATPV